MVWITWQCFGKRLGASARRSHTFKNSTSSIDAKAGMKRRPKWLTAKGTNVCRLFSRNYPNWLTSAGEFGRSNR